MMRAKRVSEFAFFAGAKFSTAIMRIDYPFHDGRPNPAHGKFFIRGTIPATCWDEERQDSKIFDSEDQAIFAAIEGGAERIQGADCRIINPADYAMLTA
jgi:hypothetical protein